MIERVKAAGKDWVALVLAIGLALSVVLLAVAVLWGVVTDREQLGETGTRVLTVAISGIVGILGFKMGTHVNERKPE